MPHHKSCAKRLKQDEKRQIRNHTAKSELKTLAKKIRISQSAEDKDVLINEYFSRLDKAAKRNIIHKNTASRKKSRMSQFVNRMKAEQANAAN